MDINSLTLLDVSSFTEEEARGYLEAIRWPKGADCTHCGSARVTKLGGAAARTGLHKCKDCRKKFTVMVGTIFEDSHIPLRSWVIAFHLMCSSKKGISAKQLQRNLKLKHYKSAWFMAHRIRYAMSAGTFTKPLEVIVRSGRNLCRASVWRCAEDLTFFLRSRARSSEDCELPDA